MSGWLGSYTTEMEIHVLHGSYKEMKALSEQVIEALKVVNENGLSFSGTFQETFEPSIQAYRKDIKIKIMH